MNQAQSARLGRFAWAASWLVLLGLGLIPPLRREALSDAAWHLYMAQQLLRGGQQGVDLIEVNPPLITWLSLPAALIHRLTGLSSWMVWVIVVGSLAVASLALVSRLVTLLEPDLHRRRTLLIVAGFTLLILPRLDFSEREHLALILTLPYTALAAVRMSQAPAPRVTALLAGITGGIGFSLKPHFLISWLLIEITLLIRSGWRSLRRDELWAVLGLGVVYAGAVLLLNPEYFPMVRRLAPLYSRYLDNGLLYAAGLAGPYLLYLAVAGLAFRAAGWPDDPIRAAFTAAFFGFLAAAILQQKGFSYHYLAATGLGILLLVRGWQTRPAPLRWHPSGIILRAGFLILPVVPLLSLIDAARELYEPHQVRYRLDPSYPALLPQVRRLAAGDPILVLSSNPNSGWPLVLDAGSSWASRYTCQWPLAALYRDQLRTPVTQMVIPEPFAARNGFEREFSDELIQDLNRYRPRLIVVMLPDRNERLWAGARRLDYLQYFGSDPRFRDFMGDYREVSRVGTYSLWLRSLP